MGYHNCCCSPKDKTLILVLEHPPRGLEIILKYNPYPVPSGGKRYMTSLYHLFPPTIHPMVVHFTIALVYLAGVAGVISLFYRKSDFPAKSFLILLIFSFVAVGAAGVAGAISGSYLRHVPGTAMHMLHTHKEYGEVTGVFVLAALVLQGWRFWKNPQRFQPSVLAVICSIIAVVMVTAAGHLGGTLVYMHGLGVQSS
jgi:uncharacterized membrane protein